MSTHELREALETHATFDDTAALARLGSVKSRVRVVRRRRRAAIAGAAAAVVATAGGLATYLPGNGNSDRQFAGMTAPATMTSLGYTYTFDKLITGDGKAKFADDIEGPILVSWADAGDNNLTVTDSFESETPYVANGDFADFKAADVMASDDGHKRTFEVSGRGQVALAVYTLSKRPVGTTDDGVTFRDDIGSARAIAAAWSNKGETDVAVTFTYPERTLVAREFCTAPKGYDMHVDIGGPRVWGPCEHELNFDAAGDTSSFPDGLEGPGGRTFKPGDQVTAHLWITRKNQDEPVSGPLPGLQMGISLYQEKPTVATIGEWPLTEYREEAGHLYRFVSVENAATAVRQLSATRAVADRPLLFVYTGGAGATRTRTTVDGEVGTTHVNGDEGVGSFLAVEGPFGSGTHTVELRNRNAAKAGIAVYEQVD
jgi:hypothetical protein